MLTTTGAEYIDHSRQRAEVVTHSARRGVGVDDASCVRYRTRGAGTHNVRTDDIYDIDASCEPAFNARKARVPRARGSALHRGRSHSLQTVLSYISSKRDRRRATDGERKRRERERESEGKEKETSEKRERKKSG